MTPDDIIGDNYNPDKAYAQAAEALANPKASHESRLLEVMALSRYDPALFCKIAYPWGEGEFAKSQGLRTWQSDIANTIGKHLRNPATRHTPLQIAVASGHGIGKVLSNIIGLDTPEGQKKWGDVEVGSSVWGRDGKPAKVINKYVHADWEFYKVTFSDGTFTYAGLEHQWQVMTKWGRVRGYAPEIVTTDDIRKNLKRGYSVPLTAPVEYSHSDCAVHPYLMGYLLGNGSMRTPGAVKVSCHEPELYGYMGSLLPKECAFRGSDKTYLNITANNWDSDGYSFNPVYVELLRLGIHGQHGHDKFIPDFFKYNSAENRIHLLRGLMDSDGTISPRKGDNGRAGYKVQYSTSSERLRDDVVWLVRSLGGTASYSVDDRRGTGYGATADNYEVHINLPNSINPFYLQRKAEMYDDYVATTKREPIKIVRSIEYDHTGDGHCITVDAPDHLYLANDFIVTHNSSLVSMLIDWALSTCTGAKVVVTANTENQLRTKTWPEVTKWVRNSINAHWFENTATAVLSTEKGQELNWRADAIPWSENNTEAFAGLHNQGKRLVLVFDESSAISDKVWEVAEGAMTDADTEIIWLAFGNPTQNTGRFRECFGKFKHRWVTRQIDSRTVDGTNKAQIQTWIDDYGEDSDFVRVRVRGEFPRSGSLQFIPSDIVEEARRRPAEAHLNDVRVMGVDVARFGDDASSICFRVGRDASSLRWKIFRGVDTMTLAAAIVDAAAEFKPDAIFVDAGGVGGGVVDRLRMLRQPVIEVQFGGRADRSMDTESGAVRYANKRAEMWGYMRDWLAGGSIPDDPDLADELTSVQYGYVYKDGRDVIILEKKGDMKKRGLSSPDKADSLALTFSYAVVPSDHRRALESRHGSGHSYQYDPLALSYVNQELSGNHKSNYDSLSVDYLNKNR